ncbi:MAG: alcohol dehydrogenase catalytic domain-containing protein [Oscillospiraceae bacterium]
MKAVVVESPFNIKISDVPAPKIENPDEVLIKVKCGGICGSDIGIYKGTNSLASYPRIIGHEFGGFVEAVGSKVKNLKVGDLVAVDPVRPCGHCYACTHDRYNVCNDLEVIGVHRDGGFAEYAVAPEKNVYKLDPNKVPAELSCLVEPYSIGVQGGDNSRRQGADYGLRSYRMLNYAGCKIARRVGNDDRYRGQKT